MEKLRALQWHRSVIGPSIAICPHPRAVHFASDGTKTDMSEALSSLDQNSVLDEVRRALGRSATVAPVPPSPLEPFNESAIQVDLSELIARFTEEATAVRANVHRVSDELQLVERIADICAAYEGHEVALSGAEIFAELDLASTAAARGFSTFGPGETDHEKLIARLVNCRVG